MGQERLAERVQISAGNKECKAWSGCTYDEYQDVLSCLWRAVQIGLLSVKNRSARFDSLRSEQEGANKVPSFVHIDEE